MDRFRLVPLLLLSAMIPESFILPMALIYRYLCAPITKSTNCWISKEILIRILVHRLAYKLFWRQGLTKFALMLLIRRACSGTVSEVADSRVLSLSPQQRFESLAHALMFLSTCTLCLLGSLNALAESPAGNTSTCKNCVLQKDCTQTQTDTLTTKPITPANHPSCKETVLHIASPAIGNTSGGCRELVAVCDEPFKDEGKSSEECTQKTSGKVEPQYYSSGVDEILFTFRTDVRASKISSQAIYQVYNLTSSQLQNKYLKESDRLFTYEKDFKSLCMTAYSLATAGFVSFHTGQNDEVVCIWCSVKLQNFKSAVDAVALHFDLSEKVCDFIKHYGVWNVSMTKVKPEGLQQNYLNRFTQATPGGGFLSPDTGRQSLALPQTFTMRSASSVHSAISTDRGPQGEGGQQNFGNKDTISNRYTQAETRSEAILINQYIGGGITHSSTPHPMRFEQNRLLSFISKGWSRMYAEHLACAGFYLIVQSDDCLIIACPFCDGKIIGVAKDAIPMFTTEKDHSPLQVHILKFPACAFIQGNNLGARGNVPIIAGEFRWNQSTIVTGDRASSQTDLADIGVATTHVDCPPMAVYERRFESFLTLPYDHPKGSEELAVAGFYYLGIGGEMKCFWCGVGSRSWQSGEDVWVRHARSMRTCQFVINEKGADFVSHVIEQHGVWTSNSREDADKIRNVTTRMLRPRMDSNVVQDVIGMGYTRDHVKTAIINRVKKLKPDYTSRADLIGDVLALRHKDMNYSRELKLPEVSVQPKSPAVVSEDETNESIEHGCDDQSFIGSASEDQEMIEAADNELHSQQPETSPEHDNSAIKSISELTVEERGVLTRQVMSQLTCKICISSAVGIIFLPCAHLVCCVTCAPAMTQCPMCRRDIGGTIKAQI